MREKKLRYAYDVYNRNVSVTGDDFTQKNHYDAEGYRDSITEKDKVTNFVYQGGMLLHELDEDKNPARHYVLGNEYIGLDHNYYLTDEQGSARYYNTGIGRFTQEDVIYNDGLNLYAYCSSNPVMYEDPSGYQSNKNQGNLNPCEITKSAAENSKTEIKAGKKYSKYIKFESINQFSKLQLKIVDFIEYDFEIDEDMIRAKSSVGEIILK